jgi:hypothetical protein
MCTFPVLKPYSLFAHLDVAKETEGRCILQCLMDTATGGTDQRYLGNSNIYILVGGLNPSGKY